MWIALAFAVGLVIGCCAGSYSPYSKIIIGEDRKR